MTRKKDDDNDGCNDNYDDNFGNFDDNYDKNQKHILHEVVLSQSQPFLSIQLLHPCRSYQVASHIKETNTNVANRNISLPYSNSLLKIISSLVLKIPS